MKKQIGWVLIVVAVILFFLAITKPWKDTDAPDNIAVQNTVSTELSSLGVKTELVEWQSPDYQKEYEKELSAPWNEIASKRLYALGGTILVEKFTEDCLKNITGSFTDYYLRVEGGLCPVGYWLENGSTKITKESDAVKAFAPFNTEQKAAALLGVIKPMAIENDLMNALTRKLGDDTLVFVVEPDYCNDNDPSYSLYRVTPAGAITLLASQPRQKPICTP